MAGASATTTVRFNDVERRKVGAAARTRGIGTSTYIRRATVEAAERDLIAAAIAEPSDAETARGE